jgi:AcrR family transcriptional regulator
MNNPRSKAVKSQLVATRDAEATKNRILDAAEVEFANAGLLGARTEAIAANTGVTKCMIFYHFVNKEGLYKAVLERAVGEYVRSLQTIDIHSTEPKQALRTFIETFLDNVATHINVHRIMVFENIQNKGRFYGQIAFASVYGPLIEILKRGMETGQFRKVNPIHTAVNIIGMCVLYFGHNENIKHLWPQGTNTLSKEMIEQHKKEAVEQAVAGVLARP